MTIRTERRARLALKVRLAKEANLPTVEAETVAMILRAEAEKPMRGGSNDLQHAGLFGDGWKQKELFT